MKLACSDCSRLPKCADAPADVGALDTHSCEAWSPTTHPVITAREDLIARFGSGALSGIRKEKPNMAHVDDLLDAVKTGNIDALQALKSDKGVQPANLMLAAARLTGDAPALANALRAIKDPDERRFYLLDVLIARAQSNVIAAAVVEAPAAQVVQVAAQVDVTEEPKRRRRRAVADTPDATDDVRAIENAKAVEASAKIENAKLAETVEKAYAAPVKHGIVSIDGQDIDLIVSSVTNVVRSAIGDVTDKLSVMVQESSTAANTTQAEIVANARRVNDSIAALSAQIDRVERNLDRIRNAFVGFEIELIGSGTLGSTPFADATADWEK